MATLIHQRRDQVRTFCHVLLWSVQQWWAALPHRPAWWGLLLGLSFWTLWAAVAWSAASSKEASRLAMGMLVVASQPVSAGPNVDDVHDHASALRAMLVPASRASNVMQDLFELAQDHGVDVQGTTHSTLPDSQAGLVRQVVSMPVKGSALSIRRFIEAALHAHAALAVQRLHIRRESGRESAVDAQVEWVLLTQPAAPAQMESGP